MRHPDHIATIADCLCGNMPAEEMEAFEAERDADAELRELTEALERVWLLPVREPVRALVGVKSDPPADTAAAGEAEWDRVLALADQADGLWRGAPISNARPRVRPWIRTLLTVAYPMILGAGWYFYVWHPRVPTGSKIIIPRADREWAARIPGVQDRNARSAETGYQETKTFALPGHSTILLRPNSTFLYKADWAPEMTGTLYGEGVLDIPEGTTWTVDIGEGGEVELGPGRYALFDDNTDHVLRISIARGRLVRGTDTARVGEGMLVELTGNTFGEVQDGRWFPKTWGREAVDRRALIYPDPTLWEALTGRSPSGADGMLLSSYARRMRDEKRDGGPGMPAGMTTARAIEEQRAFERREAENAAAGRPGERAQAFSTAAAPRHAETGPGTQPAENITIDGRPSCARCTIELEYIMTLSRADTVDYFTPASSAARDSRGRYFVLGARGNILFFGSDGMFQRRISAHGGMYEDPSITSFVIGPGDSLHVVDDKRRVEVLNPKDYGPARTFPLPGAFRQAVVVPNGRLLAALVGVPYAMRDPIHRLNPRGGIERSFGLDGYGGTDPNCLICNERGLNPSRDPERIWLVQPSRYQLERWTTTGDVERRLAVIRSPWFRPWDSVPDWTSGRSRRPTSVSSVREGDDGLLWVSAVQAPLDWKPGSSEASRSQRSDSPELGLDAEPEDSLDRYSATRIEVIDPVRRQVVASAVFPLMGVIDWDTYYRIHTDGRSVAVMDVFKAHLRRP